MTKREKLSVKFSWMFLSRSCVPITEMVRPTSEATLYHRELLLRFAKPPYGLISHRHDDCPFSFGLVTWSVCLVGC